ncbi:MAG: AAA family ATPase [Mariprofundales bacterium]|nr:AAA family ATPase [Mariprofundales bacterium]
MERHPFDDVADSSFFFASKEIVTVGEDIHEAIVRRRGLVVLTGEVGCGKTTICQRVLLKLSAERFNIAWITNPRLQPEQMMFEIGTQLGFACDSADRHSLLEQLRGHMVKNVEEDRDTVICIDEAQAIPSLETLEELRMLLNFQLANRFLVTLLFVGQPELKSMLADLPQLQQRAAINLHLDHYSREEGIRYLLSRLRAAGCSRPILTRQAAEAIYSYTLGVPRRMNHLMDRCLTLGMRQSVRLVNHQLVGATMKIYPC